MAEPEESEVILGEAGPFEEDRTIWVYHPEDDFKITVPVGARMTFGYFNPAAPQKDWGRGGHGSETMRTTCLRVYADTTDKKQLAAFLGVTGFRDLTVTKTLMRRKVTIELNHEDDGFGNQEGARKQLVQGAVVDEDSLF